MPTGEDSVRALRDALAHSPENVPLRKLLADTLRSLGRFDEAETEYRHALRAASDDLELKLALAECYFSSRKDSHAEVILDSLRLRDAMTARAHVLAARLALRAGDRTRAASEFRAALALEPTLDAPDLTAAFGRPLAQAHGAHEGTGATDGPRSPSAGRNDADAGAGAGDDVGASDDDEGDDGDDGNGGGGGGDDRSPIAQRPDIDFADVGGMDALKEEIAIKIIQPLQHPELFRAYGKKAGGGILLYGPPGCGKTLLARATAGEIDARFLAIGIHDVLDMWVGQSEKNLHALFEEARRSAPCVLFFDEVDALGARRSDFQHSAVRQVINQFLAELDGARDSNEGVLVLGATNAPWHVDAAFRRPGRFDRVLFVPPPDDAARAAILRILLAEKPQGALDFAKVAEKCKDFSGADLRAVVELAIEAKLREALKSKSARGVPAPLEERDLLAAAKQVQPSTREWFATARNYVLYSNQGGLYDDVAKYLKL
ncbi:MAG: AAA family ATPase [Planctomycetes bacterium]|nr:AAA family ATPase [Planctomycetota bacterium]